MYDQVGSAREKVAAIPQAHGILANPIKPTGSDSCHVVGRGPSPRRGSPRPVSSIVQERGVVLAMDAGESAKRSERTLVIDDTVDDNVSCGLVQKTALLRRDPRGSIVEPLARKRTLLRHTAQSGTWEASSTRSSGSAVSRRARDGWLPRFAARPMPGKRCMTGEQAPVGDIGVQKVMSHGE
jgi:hypothetical protein